MSEQVDELNGVKESNKLIESIEALLLKFPIDEFNYLEWLNLIGTTERKFDELKERIQKHL